MNDRARTIDTCVIFIFALTIYLITCCRTVYVGDAGELATVLATGGIAHPPGYPLYTILGYLWVHLFFFLRPVVAANVFSAVSAAGAASVLYLLLMRIRSGQSFAIINKALALAFAFSFPVWSQAVYAEVYTFGALLYLSALLSVVVYFQQPSKRQALLMAFSCGLVLTHHFSGGVVLSSAVLALLFTRCPDNRITFRRLLPIAGVFILPLTLYAFLILRYSPDLPINWLTDATPAALWELVSGTVYRQYVGATTIGDFGLLILRLGKDLFWYAGPILLLLGIPGILRAVQNEARLYSLIALPALLNIVFVSSYRIPDFTGYLIPTVAAAIIGIQYLLISLRFENWTQRTGLIYGLALCILVLPLFWNYDRCNLSKTFIAEQYAKDLLDSTPSGGVLLTKSDNAAHTTLYLRYIEQYRPEIEVYSTRSTLNRMKRDFGNDNYSSILTALDKAPNTNWAKEFILNQGQLPSAEVKHSQGLTYTNRTDLIPDDNIEKRLARYISDLQRNYQPGKDYKSDQVYLEYMMHKIDLLRQAGYGDANTAVNILKKQGKFFSDARTCLAIAQFYMVRKMYDDSKFWIALSSRHDQPSYIQRETYVLLGCLYRRQDRPDEALKAFRAALTISPEYEPARYNTYLVASQLKIRDSDFAAAAAYYDSLLAIEPGNMLLLYNKAQLCDNLPGRLQDAYDCYRELLNNPGNVPEDILASSRRRVREIDGMVLGPK
ncbi:MAG: DUF2723 domain-containing protein [Candidatus Zixiibacteriota bacterium]